MKKTEKTDEIKLDPAEYAYMDDMPLEGWLWEFERRSDIYKTAYSNRDYDKDGLLFLRPCRFDPARKWSEVSNVSAYLSKAAPVQVINMKWGNSLPSKEVEPFDYSDIQFRSEEGRVNISYASVKGHPLDAARHEIGKESIVMALINIDAGNKEIIMQIEDALDKWKKSLSITPKRAAKTTGGESIWKSYLIVFDIMKANNEPLLREVADTLYNAFADLRYTSERNIENYYKAALELINGGYKTFLPAVK